MLEHIQKANQRNEELNTRLRNVKIQENELRNRLDQMTKENNNETMRLNQQVEYLEKELLFDTAQSNGKIIYAVNTVPSGEVKRTRQDEIDELNEYDTVNPKSVNRYMNRLEKHINNHNDEIAQEFQRVQERLLSHFKFFANCVRDKFNQEVVQIGINNEFDKLSPIKRRDTYDENHIETEENSKLSGIESSGDKAGNEGCLTPELKQMKNSLLRAYTNPLQDYHNTINTTADFRKNNRIADDVKCVDMDFRQTRNERSTSVEQVQRREQMKKRLESHKLTQSIGVKEATNGYHRTMKSAKFLNGFDTQDPYPDQKYSEHISTPVMADTLTPRRSTSPFNLSRAKSVSVNGQINGKSNS